MKKILLSFVGIICALSAWADTTGSKYNTVFSWASPEGTPQVTGGTVTYKNAMEGATDRVNFKDGNFYTICLNGSKKEYGKGPDDKGKSSYVEIALDKALEAGDSIIITGYRNKNADKKATICFIYGDTQVADESVYGNIGMNEQPTTNKYVIPEKAVGQKTIHLTRNATQTNLFIIEFVIKRKAAVEESKGDVKDDGTINVDGATYDPDKAPEGGIESATRPEHGMATPPSDTTQSENNNGTATGINGAEAEAQIVSIVTVNGAKVNSLQKGINIVTYSNGKRVKIMK